jgi:hypothetical protein
MEDVFNTLAYIYEHSEEHYASVAVIANKELTVDIMKFVLTVTNTIVDYIDFDVNDYDKSYGIILVLEDDMLRFSIEKTEAYEGYKTFDMDYVYVSKDVDRTFVRNQAMYEGEMDIFKIAGECEE